MHLVMWHPLKLLTIFFHCVPAFFRSRSKQAIVELLYRDTIRELCVLRDRSGAADRARLQAQLATVVDQSKRIISEVCGASGANAHHLTDSLQRARRDAEVMACHMAFDLDSALENTGKAMLGLELSPML